MRNRLFKLFTQFIICDSVQYSGTVAKLLVDRKLGSGALVSVSLAVLCGTPLPKHTNTEFWTLSVVRMLTAVQHQTLVLPTVSIIPEAWIKLNNVSADCEPVAVSHHDMATRFDRHPVVDASIVLYSTDIATSTFVICHCECICYKSDSGLL